MIKARTLLIAALLAGLSLPAAAQQTLRVGKAVTNAFTFTPLDVGMKAGIFAKNGLKIDEYNFAGSAKLQQGLAAKAIDIGLGSGPELVFVAKGNSDLAVAEFCGPPAGLVLVVRPDTPIRTAADLKGRRISVSTEADSRRRG